MSLPDARGGEATPRPVPTSPGLRPGHRLVRRGDDWYLVGPRDAVRRIRRPNALVEAAAEVLAGRREPDSPELTALLTGFADAGALGEEPKPAPAGTVAVLGSGPIAEALHDVIGDTVPDPLAADIVIATAGWLPDAEWVALDRACVGTRALHLCHVDGDDVHIGPFAGPEDRPRYRDLRARRLAAVPDPELLQRIWVSSLTAPAPTPSRAVTAIAAGLMALDVQAVRAGQAAPSHGAALHIDGHSGAIRRRPILPIPEELP